MSEVVNGVAMGSGNHGGLGMIDSPESVGGYPDYNTGLPLVDNDGDGIPDFWERKYGLDPSDPEDGNAYTFSENYTNLEFYLNRLVQ